MAIFMGVSLCVCGGGGHLYGGECVTVCGGGAAFSV